MALAEAQVRCSHGCSVRGVGCVQPAAQGILMSISPKNPRQVQGYVTKSKANTAVQEKAGLNHGPNYAPLNRTTLSVQCAL